MVGLVDAMAELRASQERASPAKAARAAAERLATFCGNDHYFEDGHDDPIGQPVVTPATRRAGARVEERLPSDQAARADGGADAPTASLASGYCSVQVRLRAVSMALAARPVHPPPLAWASTKPRSGSSSTAYSDCASLDSAVFRCSTTRAGSTVGRGRSRLAITVMSSPAPAPQPPPRSGHWVAGVAECRGPTTCGQVKILDDPDELLAQALAGNPDWDAIWQAVEKPMRWAVRRILRGDPMEVRTRMTSCTRRSRS